MRLGFIKATALKVGDEVVIATGAVLPAPLVRRTVCFIETYESFLGVRLRADSGEELGYTTLRLDDMLLAVEE